MPVDPWIGPRGSAAERVLQILREHGPRTRPDVARLTGMSVSGIRPLVATLLEDGRLVERDADPVAGRGRGRPGKVLAAVVPDGRVVGLDFGHSHVTVALGDLSGAIRRHARAQLDVDGRAEDALHCAARLLAGLTASPEDTPIERVVAGLPGPVDRSGRMRSSTIASSWWQVPVVERVSELLELETALVDVENDAQLGAVGEFRYGAGSDCTDGIYVKASHGLGAGLVLRGQLYTGADGLTGEIGHAVVRPEGLLCRCGGRGCLETVVAVQRVSEQARFVAGVGDDVPLAELMDHAAPRLVADAGRALGRALADVCNLLNPRRIVVGGELAAAGAPLVDGVVESIGRFGQPAIADTEVVLTELGADAEMLGAVHLAAERARHAVWART